MNTKGTAAIIQNYDDTFLLHLRDGKANTMKNEWCLIGGTVEQDELITEALVREVKEETNLDIIELIFIRTFNFNKKEISIYQGKVDTRKQNILLAEGKEVKFFSSKKTIQLINSLSYTNPYLECIKEYLLIQSKKNFLNLKF